MPGYFPLTFDFIIILEPQYIEDEVDEPIQSVLHEMVHTEHGMK